MTQQRDFTKGFRHATLHRIAAVLWLGLAGFLFIKGVGLVQRAFSGEGGAPFKAVTHWAGGSESAVSLLIALGVIIGLLKGRFALR